MFSLQLGTDINEHFPQTKQFNKTQFNPNPKITNPKHSNTHREKAQMLKRVYYNQEIKPKVNNHSNIKQHTHHKTTKAQKGILQSQFNQYPIQLSPKSPIFMPIQHNPTSQTSKTKQPQQINSNKKRHRESVCVPEGVGNRRET